MKNFSMISRMQRLFIAVLLSTGITLMNSQSFAQSVWSVNGHTYEAVYAPGLTWAQAQAACEARGGYLATITSAEENDFIKSLFENNSAFWYFDGANALGPWIGGIQASGSSEPGGGWGWLNGEPFSYTDWSSHDPDNCCGLNQNRIEFIRDGNVPPTRWTDVEDFAGFVRGYIFESSPSTTTCVPAPSGLVSWWPGENNANDIQSSNHGTLQNGATFSTGKAGQAFSFDGVNDFIRIEDNSNLRLGTGEITIDAWVIASPSNTFRAIAAKVGLSFPFPGYALRVSDDNKVEFFAVDCATGSCGFSLPGGSGSRQPVRSTSVVADNNFHHVTGVRRSDGTLDIYVDGVLENTRLEPLRNTDSADPFTIGEIDAVGPEQPFNGIIDEVDIYNRALSTSEIHSIYAAGSAGKCKECTPPDVSITGGESVCPNTAQTYTANTNAANPTFEWSVTGGTINGDNTGNSISVIAGTAGTMTVSVEVTDGTTSCSNSASQNVTVEDNQVPVITITTNPITLWPPNHQYVTINVSQCVASVTDNCATLSASNVIITKVTSDEPEDAKGGGDGNTLNDMVIAANCQSVQLRSERQGSGNGRVYTIHLSVNDGNGNTGTATRLITVPKSQNGNPAVNDGPVYTVGSSCGSGTSKLSQQDFTQERLPEGYALEQNYPNPFNPSTSIAFSVKEAGVVQLTIYNLHGQEVRALINGQMNAGFHSMNWDGKDERGQIVPSGVYLYKLRVNGFAQTRKMTLMK